MPESILRDVREGDIEEQKVEDKGNENANKLMVNKKQNIERMEGY